MNGSKPDSIFCMFGFHKIRSMKYLLLAFIISTSALSYSHDYFFAFAEVEYNDISKRLEATLTASTHDLEGAIRETKTTLSNIESIDKGSEDFKTLEEYLLRHFKISSTQESNLKLIGFEVLMSGVTNFFFESNQMDLKDTLDISFDLLMLQHQEQQNKITFYYRNNTYTRPFLYDVRKQKIKLLKN